MELLKLKALKAAEANGNFTEDLMEPGGPDGNWYAEESVVGDRVLVEFTTCGAYDRSFQLFKLMDVTNDQKSQIRAALNGNVVDGKIRTDGQLVLFDCLMYKGKDVRAESLVRRRRHLRQIVDTLSAIWPQVEIVPNVTLLGLTPKQLLEKCLKEGKPGIVLKDLSSLYGQKDSWIAVDKKGGRC